MNIAANTEAQPYKNKYDDKFSWNSKIKLDSNDSWLQNVLRYLCITHLPYR